MGRKERLQGIDLQWAGKRPDSANDRTFDRDRL